MRKFLAALMVAALAFPFAAAFGVDTSKAPLYHFSLDQTFSLNSVSLDAGAYLIRVNGNRAAVFSGSHKVAVFEAKVKGAKRAMETPFEGRVELIRVDSRDQIQSFKIGAVQVVVGRGLIEETNRVTID